MSQKTDMRHLFLILTFALVACSHFSDAPTPYERPQAQTAEEIDYVRNVLNGAQKLSFDQNREFCGYILLDGAGDFTHTPLKKGRASHCRPPAPDEDAVVIASFHTHGAFSEDHESEVPSSDDLKADIYEGVDGYISTPGGRLWYSHAGEEFVNLICGPNCLISDPNYESYQGEPKDTQYNLAELEALEE